MCDDHDETFEIIFMYSQEAIHSKFDDLCNCSMYFVQKMITSFCGYYHYQQQMASIAHRRLFGLNE